MGVIKTARKRFLPHTILLIKFHINEVSNRHESVFKGKILMNVYVGVKSPPINIQKIHISKNLDRFNFMKSSIYIKNATKNIKRP